MLRALFVLAALLSGLLLPWGWPLVIAGAVLCVAGVATMRLARRSRGR